MFRCVRNLPALLRRLPESCDLEQGWFHRVLSALARVDSLPHPVPHILVGMLDLISLRWLGRVGTAALALAQLADWPVVMLLPGLRISFGPTRVQWLSLSALRIAAALLLGRSIARPRGRL